MATRMQQRRGTAPQWISTNQGNGPILAPGEIGFESDTNKFKIGDGVNHWVDLDYFTTDSAESVTQQINAAISNLVDGAPGLLNTLNELAAAINDDPTFFTTIATNLSNHESDTTNVHGILDTDELATKEYVTQEIGNSTVDQAALAGEGITWNGGTQQFDIDSTVATKTYADDAAGAADTSARGYADSLATNYDAAGTASSAVSTHNSDSTSVHGITDTAELATKTFAAELLTNATKTNVTITGDKNGLTITAENGVADSTTDNLTEGSTNKYFTDERAQDAVGNALGHGLKYTDSTGVVEPDLALSGGLYIDNTDKLAVDGFYVTFNGAEQTLTNKTLTSPVINTPTGITKSDVGLANVDNTTDANKPVSTATQTALDLKAPIANPTFTGTVTLPADPASALQAATKQYVDNTASGIVAKPQVLGATTANIDATYSNGTAGVGATLTHNTNGVFPAESGGASGWAVGKGILVKNQTNKEENGRYYVSDMGSLSTPYVLTRCGYCDEANEIPGAYIFVQDGTFAGTGWIQVVADPATFTVGADDIDVYQFSGSGTITAGTGITVNGNQVSIDTAVTQARVENVSDTEIGYLNGVTSSIQTQLDDKAASADIAELAQDAVGNAVGTGLTYTDSTGAIAVDTAYLANALVVEGSGLSGTGGNIGIRLGNYVTVENYDLTVDGYSLLNAWTKPNGGIVLDGPSGIMVDTTLIAPLNSPTFTGTVDFTGATVSGIDALPSQTGEEGKYLTTDGTDASWAELVVPITTGTQTISENTAAMIDMITSEGAVEYTIRLKQGTKIRTSKLIVNYVIDSNQSPSAIADSTEFAILETNGTIPYSIAATPTLMGIFVEITVTDAATTNVDVKFSKVVL